MSVHVLDELASSVEQMNPDKAMVLSKHTVEAGIDLADIVENGIVKGLRRVGERFEKGEAFLTDLIGAAAAAKGALESVLRSAVAKARTSQRSLGKVVLGTVSGDIHDMGKIVAAMPFASGFEVMDLELMSRLTILLESNATGAKIVGASALLSTTLPVQREIVNEFVKRRIRDRHNLLVGGAPATEQWAKELLPHTHST